MKLHKLATPMNDYVKIGSKNISRGFLMSESMKAKTLYRILHRDFDLDTCRDDWSQMDFSDFIGENFKRLLW